jgi:hypothetical protein
MGAKRAAQAAAALCAAFWVLITIGGTANPGYRQYEEYVSGLAASGAEQPIWGIAALLCLAGTVLVVAPALRTWDPLVARATAVGGGGLILVAAARMGCPPGARFCQRGETDPLADLLHAGAVLFVAAALLFALFAAVLHVRRGAGGRARALAAGSGATVALAVVGYPLLTLTGLQQRFLILALQGAILAAAAAAHGEGKRIARVRAKEVARTAAPH